MAQYVFGTGQLYALPTGGNGAPLRFGALQDVGVDFSADTKQLFGQYQFPLDVARGKTKIEWQASSGQIDVESFNQVYFGQTVTAGQKRQVFNEAASVPADPGPYTVTAANGAHYFMDLGVYNQTTGLPLKQVSSAPATGQYSVNPATGVYTFAAADAGKPVFLNYLWTDAAQGQTLEISNILMGTTPKFQLVLSQVYNGKTITMVLYSCVAEKLGLPLKQDDYLISEFGGQAQANDAGNIGFITTTG